MRGKPEQQLAMLTSLSTEDLIPEDHPVRRIRRIVDVVLGELDGEFDAMYSRLGRPSIPPEQLLKATVLMALYSLRSERAFCERLNYDLLFGPWRRQGWSTSIVDVGAGRLLDVVPGRSAVEPCRWLAERGEPWLANIRWTTVDLSGPYRAVFDTMVPHA
jgi:hypothetical protein